MHLTRIINLSLSKTIDGLGSYCSIQCFLAAFLVQIKGLMLLKIPTENQVNCNLIKPEQLELIA